MTAKTAAARKTTTVKVVPFYAGDTDGRILLNGRDGGATVHEGTSWKSGSPVAFFEVKAGDSFTTGTGAQGRCYNGAPKYYTARTRDEAVALFAADRERHTLMTWRKQIRGGGSMDVYADGTPIRYSRPDADGCVWRLPMDA